MSDPLLAAGGIVFRLLDENQIEVLLVGGSSTDLDYRGFPKGKLESGETFEQAARREVREEAGIIIDLLALAGISHYTITTPDQSAVDKVVRYYLARPLGGSLSDQDGERRDVGWVKVSQARTQLTYDEDREHLAQALHLLSTINLYHQLTSESSNSAP